MSAKAFHALLTLVVGVSVGIYWLRTFWHAPQRVPAGVLAAPVAVALLGLSHWVAYDFSYAHWPAGFSLLQAGFNVAVVAALFVRRAAVLPSAA